MKKVFVKPTLKKLSLHLNEDIAGSIEYWRDKGLISSLYYFEQYVGTVILKNDGCYELLSNNPAWNTAYSPSDPVFINEWLAHNIAEEKRTNPDSTYITACFNTTS